MAYSMKIPITKLSLDSQEVEAVKDVLESGWLIQGKKVLEFEKLMGGYINAKYAVACSSCTTALHMALLALGVKAGDEVIVPTFTFVATPNAVEYVGAKPIFVDVDLKTFNIDVGKLKSTIATHPKVAAIIPVHLFGMCANIDAVMDIAQKHGLSIVEDAACALGSTYKGKYAGSLGDVGCFSFHPRKSLTTGEGGMLVTKDESIYKQVHSLRDFGFESTNLDRHKASISTMPEVDILGYNYRMTDIQAAIGVVQFHKFSSVVEGRQKRAKSYDENLKGISWLQLPQIAQGCNHTYQSYVTLVWDWGLGSPTLEKIAKMEALRNKLVSHLSENDIFTRQGTQAVHALGYYKKKYGIKDDDYPNTLAAAKLSVTLPLYPQMTDNEQRYVIDKIKEVEN